MAHARRPLLVLVSTALTIASLIFAPPAFAAQPNGDHLLGVSCFSVPGAWAVGYAYDGIADSSLILRRSVGGWKRVPSDDRPGATQNILQSVDAVSVNDAWAVGYWNGPAGIVPLTMHWDGLSWKRRKTAPISGGAYLSSVSTLSGSSAWAVGERLDGGTLIAHWDGRDWSNVSAPSPQGAALTAVSAVSPKNVWAVGSMTPGGSVSALIEHWNGTKWRMVPSQTPSGAAPFLLSGVTAVAGGTAISVGSSTAPQAPLAEHGGATGFNVVATPNPGQGRLSGVSTSATGALAVGSWQGAAMQTLIERWDGSSWQEQPSANVLGSDNELASVDAMCETPIVVGTSTSAGVAETLIEEWNGSSWNIVVSQNP